MINFVLLLVAAALCIQAVTSMQTEVRMAAPAVDLDELDSMVGDRTDELGEEDAGQGRRGGDTKGNLAQLPPPPPANAKATLKAEEEIAAAKAEAATKAWAAGECFKTSMVQPDRKGEMKKL